MPVKFCYFSDFLRGLIYKINVTVFKQKIFSDMALGKRVTFSPRLSDEMKLSDLIPRIFLETPLLEASRNF